MSMPWRWTAPATSTPGEASFQPEDFGKLHRQVEREHLVRPWQRHGWWVSALALDGAGNLYAGGGFLNAGGVWVGHIAKWNGSTWSALGSFMSGVPYPGSGRHR